jgi:hypothetical protein
LLTEENVGIVQKGTEVGPGPRAHESQLGAAWRNRV